MRSVLLENLSRVGTKRIRPLVSFVEKFGAYSALATVRVKDAAHAGDPISGSAVRCSTGLPTGTLFVAPSLITLSVGSEDVPRVLRHMDPEVTVGDVRVRGWDEEFVFVLAHESQHISEFWSGVPAGELQAEQAAEEHAVKVLKEYRRQLRESFVVSHKEGRSTSRTKGAR
jgi:hypothetical protein